MQYAHGVYSGDVLLATNRIAPGARLKVAYLFASEQEVGNFITHLNLQGHSVEKIEVYLGQGGWNQTYFAGRVGPDGAEAPAGTFVPPASVPVEINFSAGGLVRIEVELVTGAGGGNLFYTRPVPGGHGRFETYLAGEPEPGILKVGLGVKGIDGAAAAVGRPPIPA